MLVLLSLLLVIARKRANLTQQVGIYLIKTLCLWGGFAFGWAIARDSTRGSSLARFLLTWIAWWVVSAFVGTLLSIGWYLLYKGVVKSSPTRT
jgi:hypothetical protein